MSVVHIPQIYFWKVDFVDGTHLAQFDEYGNEILIKNIVGQDCKQYNSKTKQDEIIVLSNYFSEYEKIHGNVVQFGFYPFTEEMRQKIHAKNPEIVFAVVKGGAVPMIKEIPKTHFATFKKSNLIEYGISTNGFTEGVSGRLGQLTIGIVNRESKIADLFEINMVQVKA